MSCSPSRRQRRDLGRRADRLLTQARGRLVECDREVSARTHVVLVGEGTAPIVAHRDAVAFGFILTGLDPSSAREALAELEASPKDDGTRLPCLILIDGWLQPTWIQVHALTKGGEA